MNSARPEAGCQDNRCCNDEVESALPHISVLQSLTAWHHPSCASEKHKASFTDEASAVFQHSEQHNAEAAACCLYDSQCADAVDADAALQSHLFNHS